jgi:hypothetical protein
LKAGAFSFNGDAKNVSGVSKIFEGLHLKLEPVAPAITLSARNYWPKSRCKVMPDSLSAASAAELITIAEQVITAMTADPTLYGSSAAITG